MPDCMFFRTYFAFYDYSKSAARVFLETVLIFFFWYGRVRNPETYLAGREKEKNGAAGYSMMWQTKVNHGVEPRKTEINHEGSKAESACVYADSAIENLAKIIYHIIS